MQIGIDLLIIVIILVTWIYVFGYYYYYLKKYDIQKIGSNNWYFRMWRVSGLISLAFFMKSNSWLAKKIDRTNKTDWYRQQYLRKVPYEVIKPYRKAFFLLVFMIVLLFMNGFIDRMGWNFSFYWK